MRDTVLTVVGSATTACAIAAVVFDHAGRWATVLTWVLLVPWLVTVDRARSLRGALVAGGAMSIAFVVAVFSWFPEMLANYTGMPWSFGVAVLLGLAPVLEPQFVVAALARYATRAAGGARWQCALVSAGFYVATDWAWPKLFADALGHCLYASPWLRQAADLVGVHGLTFFVVLGNECVLAILDAVRAAPRWFRTLPRQLLAPAGCLVLLLTVLAAYGAVRVPQLRSARSGVPVTVALVQGNLAHYDRLRATLGTFEAVQMILDRYFALSTEALRGQRADLLVWSETVYPTTFGRPKSPEGADFDDRIARFVVETGVPLVFGAYGLDGDQESNAAFLLDPRAAAGPSMEVYRKSRLFPFTEYLPWPFDSERIRPWMPWAGTWASGHGPGIFTLELPGRRRVLFAPLICYDAMDPAFVVAAVRQGAEVLLTLSNDSWFAFPRVQRLIMIVAAFRSIETRRPQLRATPTGVSAVIDETGDLLDLLDVDQRGVLVATVQASEGSSTLMLAWGNWFPPAAFTGSLVLLLAVRSRPGRAPRRRRGRRVSRSHRQ